MGNEDVGIIRRQSLESQSRKVGLRESATFLLVTGMGIESGKASVGPGEELPHEDHIPFTYRVNSLSTCC